jgi:hypothetical protein
VIGVHGSDVEFPQQRDELRVLKLSCRTSTTWRSFRPLNVPGSSSRKAPKSASSNFLNGANCQSRGPSLSPSSVTPELRNRSIDSPASLNTRRLVT